MKITRQEAEHIAHLARLEFNEEEIESFTAQLDNILTHFEKLKEVDTAFVEPTSHAIILKNVFREDSISESAAKDAILANAPDRESNCFRVPKIIE